VFRLIRLLIGVTVLAVVAYVAVAVPLGGKTLWEHLRSIASTKESQELVDGVKHKAREVIGRDAGLVRRTSDKLTGAERKLLRRLIRDKLAEEDKRSSVR